MSENQGAETLRKAASLMRARAEATYLTTDEGGTAGWHTPADLVGVFEEDGDADFIASWHPEVALAVADLLDRIADDYAIASYGYWSTCAVSVARAYLGSES